MKKIKILLLSLLTAGMIFGMVLSASATTIYINLSTTPALYGEETSQADITTLINAYLNPDPTLLYYASPDDGESGPYATYYDTTFSGGNEAAIVINVGPGYISTTPVYLLAKDGAVPDNNSLTHAWYFYNLTALGWTGIQNIDISGLWPDQGSFSHLSLYGTPGTSVPEPFTIVLLGFGLVGLAGVGRKLKK